MLSDKIVMAIDQMMRLFNGITFFSLSHFNTKAMIRKDNAFEMTSALFPELIKSEDGNKAIKTISHLATGVVFIAKLTMKIHKNKVANRVA